MPPLGSGVIVRLARLQYSARTLLSLSACSAAESHLALRLVSNNLSLPAKGCTTLMPLSSCQRAALFCLLLLHARSTPCPACAWRHTLAALLALRRRERASRLIHLGMTWAQRQAHIVG